MYEIDRSMMVVRPKQPFFDWVQSVDYEENLTLERVREDPSAYLVPQFWDNDNQHLLLEIFYDVVFEAELDAWYTDPDLWPPNRNLKMFLEWFDIEFHSGVFDLCDEPIQMADYSSEDDGEPGSNGN